MSYKKKYELLNYQLIPDLTDQTYNHLCHSITQSMTNLAPVANVQDLVAQFARISSVKKPR